MKGRREKGRSVPSVTISERKKGKRKEPVTSVMILMQPMAVAYMKLDNHAGSKGHPLLIYRKVQGLCPQTPGCIPTLVLAALHPNLDVGCTTSQS